MKKIKHEKKLVETKVDEVLQLKDQLARALADYANLQKRSEEEKLTWIRFATQRFVQSLLPVLDTFEAAQNHVKDSGLAIAINQFRDLLKQEGLEEIRPKLGDNFDENLMEVVETVNPPSPEATEGTVAEVLMIGWKFAGGNVIRHAKVKVYKSSEKAS